MNCLEIGFYLMTSQMEYFISLSHLLIKRRLVLSTHAGTGAMGGMNNVLTNFSLSINEIFLTCES